MPKDNVDGYFTLFTVLLIFIVFITMFSSFKNDVPDCQGYITNVYLYLILGFILVAFFILLIAKYRLPITRTKSLAALVVSIALLFCLYNVNPRQVLLNHLLWVSFLACIAIGLFFFWRYSEHKHTITSSLTITFILFIGLTILVYLKPEWISLNWGVTLVTALIILILSWIVPRFLGVKETMYYKVLSIFSIFLFSALVLYDTKVIYQQSQTCVFPNYPKDSLGLFLDVIHLFIGSAKVS